MSLNLNDFQSVQDALSMRFLYRNDSDSLHVLLSLLESEFRVKKLKPKYMCMTAITRSVRRVLKNRNDAAEIEHALRRSINDDINRLECAVYLEAYARGYRDKRWIDALETVTLKSFPVETLYNRTALFHTRLNSEALVTKNHVMDDLDAQEEIGSHLRTVITKYGDKILRKKVFRLNVTLNRQLMLWQDSGQSTPKISEPSILVTEELERIYQRILVAYSKSIYRLYKEAYWYGINDCVLARY